ncbi:MAG: aspartyl-tRNA(Asn)/glutamyl-tRNA(Gln) amidotransferase subunit [Campylobacterota bacterium]|nr:aspartyl-tRNA(Asn)/glutamyl-tRNA(Gln) amidotransferase subunit [Campylobacterota bacterium]
MSKGSAVKIDENLLQRLEKLSYLQIPQEHREEMIGQLSEIVSFVDNLSELSTEGISPTFTMSDASTRLREDNGSVNRRINDDILNNAPRSKDHFFIVPKIIE